MKTASFALAGLLAAGSAGAATLQRAPVADVSPDSVPVALGARPLAQMDDDTPVDQGGVACSDFPNAITYQQSWWRRFYLAEHGAPSSLRIESVTVGTEFGVAPVSVRLYSIPHASATDTIDPALLRPIGRSDTVMVRGELNTATIPVTGLLADAAADDLVVEYHTDGTMDWAFYAGANPSPETHPSFLSAPDCGVPTPTPTAQLGFPDAHFVIVANMAAPGVGAQPSLTPATIASGEVSRLEIALANPLPSSAALTSAFTVALPPGLFVAPVPNATTTCGGSVTATAMGSSVSLGGGAIAAKGACRLGVDVTSLGGRFEVAIPAGALHTSQGDSTQPSSASLVVVPVGGNGLVRSGPLNRLLEISVLGTSYDLVGSAVNYAGVLGANWDLSVGLAVNFNAPALVVFGFNASPGVEFALNANGEVARLGDGDVVGPDTWLDGGYGMPADPAWYAGTDGAVGVRFPCAERVAYPIVGGDHCYGYVRLATTAPSGIPVRLIESAFDGDGKPITVRIAAVTNPPTASVAPASISLSVAADAVSQQELTLSNAAGSAPLRYSPSGQGIAAAARPEREDLARAGAATQRASRFRLPSSPFPLRQVAVHGFDAVPWNSAGGFLYALDDGAYEKASGLSGAGIWLNRYSVIEAQTIDSVSVMWPAQRSGNHRLLGQPVNLVAYYDADGDGDPTNAVRLGGDRLVTIDAIDRFQTYPTQFEVPGAGDVYVGVVDQWAMNGNPEELYAIAIDTSTYGGASYLSINLPGAEGAPPPNVDDLGANQVTALVGAMGLAGNFTFRATGSGTSCGGAGVSWLRINGQAEVVAGGTSARLRFQVDPAAGALDPGTHHAELCIVTNDPARRTLSVPVTVQVTAPMAAHACAGNGDRLFCDGFDRAEGEAIVRSGRLDLDLPPTWYGLTFDFARGDWGGHPLAGDDFAAYHGGEMAPYMLFYWYGANVEPDASGGVAETVFGPYRVLRSGDTIGPDSVFSAIISGRYSESRHFLEGVDGYMGFRFFNEQTRQTNYGYVHLRTTAPTGYPAKVLDYAYDRTGAPITIP